MRTMLNCRQSWHKQYTHTFSRRQSLFVKMQAQSTTDLLVIGPGVLGGYLGHKWLHAHEGSKVVGLTNGDQNHSRISSLGLTPMIKEETQDLKFPNVVFCVPPSASEDYPGEVRRAIEKWDGTGTFVFTSSIGVCDVTDGKCDENSPLVPLGKSPRLDKMLLAEKHTLEAGGNVLRLVGLYHCNRGAHTFFLSKGTVERPAGYVVNLIHYEDAVGMCQKILEHEDKEEPFKGQLFLGCDNHPISFKDMMEATMKSGKFEGGVEFVGPQEVSEAKLVNNEITMKRLNWKPKYESFQSFMESGGDDVYNGPLYQ
eukprot:TRINITY_DN384_c2_g1_i1.p1 TRINITY_DN384_c2_g1~~TRINITY_DN384_c2_g1_i1.p1  ORF type:complete len:312 (-),score=23.52 TRINITY_DN384_c2_g1_i1:311-1246(-)